MIFQSGAGIFHQHWLLGDAVPTADPVEQPLPVIPSCLPGTNKAQPAQLGFEGHSLAPDRAGNWSFLSLEGASLSWSVVRAGHNPRIWQLELLCVKVLNQAQYLRGHLDFIIFLHLEKSGFAVPPCMKFQFSHFPYGRRIQLNFCAILSVPVGEDWEIFTCFLSW